MTYFCLPDTPARVGVVASGWPENPTSLAGIAEQMALARQAQRCAVGKLDCYCGCRYCGYHDDADGVQVRRVYERKFILNLLDLKSRAGKIYWVGNSST